MGNEHVRQERRDGVIRLVLDRPPLNVLHTTMLEELAAALERVAGDGTVKAVVLTGAGRAFCAGVDVADHTAERVGPMLEAFHDVIGRLLALEPPTVALVNGAALGGGCELLLACDVVLARSGAKIGQPEIQLGVFPPAAAALMPRLLGRQRALDLILTGRTLPAEEAFGLGLVTRVLDADGFEQEAEAYLAGLARLSGPVLRLAKRAVSEASDGPVRQALRAAESLYLDELMSLADAHEGLAAFLEKREPAWKEG